MADDHTTSPVSDAMVLKIMAERERDLGFTVYADWLDAGCPDKGADDQWEYPQEKIDDVRFYIVAMKAKEEAADPVDSEVKNIVSNWHSFKGQTADQPSADEIERVANDLAVKVTEHAIMELDADEENTAQIEAFGTLVEQEFRSALSAIRNTPQAIEATPRSDGESEK